MRAPRSPSVPRTRDARREHVTIDGFRASDKSAYAGFRADVFARTVRALARAARILHVEVEGVDKIPEGRALLVANHTFGFDVAFACAEVWRVTGRHVWSLGEHAWWRFPWLRRLAADIGIVDGTQENAEKLLENGELVLVLPGGLRESVKPRDLRYRLLWREHLGFARLAIRTQSPIVPLAAIGADDVFDWVRDAFERGERLTGFRGLPIPRPRWGIPIVHRTHLRYVFGDPIPPGAPPEQATDEHAQKRLQHEVRGALDELLTEELAHRAHVRT